MQNIKHLFSGWKLLTGPHLRSPILLNGARMNVTPASDEDNCYAVLGKLAHKQFQNTAVTLEIDPDSHGGVKQLVNLGCFVLIVYLFVRTRIHVKMFRSCDLHAQTVCGLLTYCETELF